VFAAIRRARPGDTFVPRLPAATVENLARAMIGSKRIATKVVGIRPGEKLHEIMVSEEEAYRTERDGEFYVIRATLPEVALHPVRKPALQGEYSSAHSVVGLEETRAILHRAGYAL
jgi:UDP-glucose 4-epimerase